MIEFLGNFHPAAVHFPAALIVTAGLALLSTALGFGSGLGGAPGGRSANQDAARRLLLYRVFL